MTRTITAAERGESLAALRGLLHPGDTVWTSVSHVAPSGMTRWIRAFVIRDGEPQDISWRTARVLGSPVNTRNHEGVERGGCGMDMGFDLVYSLSRTLFRDGWECPDYIVSEDGHIIERHPDQRGICQGSDHSNRVNLASLVQSGKVMHTGDGGYALNQRWL